jgi:hypothetical protein
MKNTLNFAIAALFIVTFSTISHGQAPANPATKLDTNLKPSQDSAETISQVFKEMVVVQRKAKEKEGHLLLNRVLAILLV